MDIHSITVEIPVIATVVVSTVTNTTCLEVHITDDAADDLCEKGAEELHNKRVTSAHPVIYMHDHREKLYLNIPTWSVSQKTGTLPYEGLSMQCTMYFSLRCSVAGDDDVTVDRVRPFALSSIIGIL